jgi:hypothetical protein
MTKTELQSALAEATQTDKRIAGVFLDTQSQDATEDQDSSQDRRQISCGQGRKGRGLGVKK